MTDRQLFGVVVRVFGLFLLLYAASLALYLVLHLAGVAVVLRQSLPVDLAFMALCLVLGVFLIKGADAIVRLAYGRL